jgi:hypothetical protein
MQLATRITPNCANCRLRPREEGGSGSCPLTGTTLAIHQERGKDGADNGCWAFDPRPYYSPAERKAYKNGHQEEALF